MNELTQIRQVLPPNTTPLERIAAQALGELSNIPIPIRTLGNAEQCPLTILPYLAWAHSVDHWDTHWSEQTKRAVTRDAFFVHQKKGTISALRRAVAPFGFLLHIKEWWQTFPPQPAGTFSLELGVIDQGLSDSSYAELVRVIDDAKPISRHLIGLAISLEVAGSLNAAIRCYEGDTMTIYSLPPGPVHISLPINTQSGIHTIDTLAVFNYPLPHLS